MNSNQLKIKVNRHQYGVGQGCFHVQELVFSGPETSPLQALTYRFVYDCGASSFQKEKTLEWSIKHATAGAEPLVINAVYLSHFEADHVNGLKKLCQTATVNRIYAPHITQDQVLHIIAQQLFDGVNWTAEYETFVNTVLAVARGDDIYGVPVTLMTSEGVAPEVQTGDVIPNRDLNEPSIKVDAPIEKTVSHSSRTNFSLSESGVAEPLNINKWELIHWCYVAEKSLTDAIQKEISLVGGYFAQGQSGLLANANAKDIAITLTWIQKHHKEIAMAYKKAMKSFNIVRKKKSPPEPEIPDNHNVVSLCLYSGPAESSAVVKRFNHSNGHSAHHYPFFIDWHRGNLMAWIATGDAMLERPDIWESFKNHFSIDRIKKCSTVLIPHHGAGAKTSQNFNVELIHSGQICVIGVGAKNPYHHPHRNVVNAILDAGANVQIVTEISPLGFFERLEVSCD